MSSKQTGKTWRFFKAQNPLAYISIVPSVVRIRKLISRMLPKLEALAGNPEPSLWRARSPSLTRHFPRAPERGAKCMEVDEIEGQIKTDVVRLIEIYGPAEGFGHGHLGNSSSEVCRP